jgi:hypothetical protein
VLEEFIPRSASQRLTIICNAAVLPVTLRCRIMAVSNSIVSAEALMDQPPS